MFMCVLPAAARAVVVEPLAVLLRDIPGPPGERASILYDIISYYTTLHYMLCIYIYIYIYTYTCIHIYIYIYNTYNK